MRFARRCLDDERYRLATAITLLMSDSTPQGLLDQALDGLHGGKEWINTLCVRSEIPEVSLRRLLKHTDPAIASAAALGMWNADPEGEIPDSLREDWSHAILRCSGDEWFLRQILQANSALAVRWLSKVLQESAELWRYEDTIYEALHGLAKADRRQIMGDLPEDLYPPRIVRRLIGGDLDLYQELLQNRRLKRLHLAPLISYPNLSDWTDKAQLALDAGYTVEGVVDAAFGQSWSWSGNESAMWNEWVERFDELQRHASDRIRQIGVIGRDLAAQRRDRALERERTERVRGVES